MMLALIIKGVNFFIVPPESSCKAPHLFRRVVGILKNLLVLTIPYRPGNYKEYFYVLCSSIMQDF